MSSSEQILSLIVSARDDASATLVTVGRNLTNLGNTATSAGGRVTEFLERGRTKFREFGRAGSELATVAAVIGGQFGEAGGAIGEFSRLLADALLVGHAMVDLGPGIASAASAAVGLGGASNAAAEGITREGAAAAAATPEVAGLATAEGAASAGAVGLGAAVSVMALPVAVGVAALGALTIANNNLREAALASAIAESNWTDAEKRKAEAAAAGGKIMDNEVRQLIQVGMGHAKLSDAVWNSTRADDYFAQGLDKTAATAADFIEKQKMLAIGAEVDSGYFRQFTTDADETGRGLDNVGARAIAAAHGFDVLASSAFTAAQAEALAAQQRLSAIQVHGPSADIAGAGRGLPGFEDLGRDSEFFIRNAQQHTQDVYRAMDAAARRRGGGGSRGGGSAASSLAQQIADENRKAWEASKEAGDNYYDAIHNRNRQAIQDAQTASRAKIDGDHKATQDAIDGAHREANARIAGARRVVDAQLTEQMRINAAPVTAAEADLRSTENAEQLRNLQEALAAAQQGQNGIVDPRAVRDAQESLANFQTQLGIESLRSQQAAEDEQARAAADKAQHGVMDPTTGLYDTTGSIDAQQAAEDAAYEKRKADEETVYQTRLSDSDKRYAAKLKDEDVRAERQKKLFDAHVAAMEASKKSTDKLAVAEEKRFLQEQLAYAKQYGTAQDAKYAQADLNDFLTGLPKHARGGIVGGHGAELGWLGENEREAIIPESQWGAMGGTTHHFYGDIVLPNVQKPQDFMRDFQRWMRTNGYSTLPPAK